MKKQARTATYLEGIVMVNNLGKHIKRIRESKRLTQAQLAQKVGVTQGYISQIEVGSRQLRVKHLIKIARALKQNPIYFLR